MLVMVLYLPCMQPQFYHLVCSLYKSLWMGFLNPQVIQQPSMTQEYPVLKAPLSDSTL
jgi:hypothetical protein